MQKEYMLEGLCCANCANKIETAVKGMDGVVSASVNFLTTTLRLDAEDHLAEGITPAVERIVHKFEPDVAVLDKAAAKGHVQDQVQCHGECCGGHEHEHEHEHSHDHSRGRDMALARKNKTMRLAAGAALFVLGYGLSVMAGVPPYAVVAVFLTSYIVLGVDVLLKAARNITKGQIFDENFLMSVATIGALAIGNLPEAVAVMLFYQVGEFFQDMAVTRSKRSITELMDIRPDYAVVERDGLQVRVSPEAVAVGDVVIVSPGEKIPLDGVILSGVSTLNQAALTGESVPRDVSAGDAVISGCVNESGVLTIRVTKNYGESTVSKIIDLVENAGAKKAPTEHFITTFSRYYTPAVVGLAALIAIVPPLFMGGDWADWIHRGLICLVISCPCALVISIPLGFFGGIGGASKLGVLVKGGNYLEALNSLDIVVFDKTGTLTSGSFEVTQVCPAGGLTQGELLELAAYAEAYSSHPIAMSIKRAYGNAPDKRLIDNYKEIPGHGVSVTANGRRLLAGGARLMAAEGVAFEEAPEAAGTTLHLARDGEYAGRIVIADAVKPDSRGLVAALKERGVRRTVMLTGDNKLVGEAIAQELGLDEVYSELLPAEKVQIVERLEAQKRPGGKIAVVGDGINDAPVLARADIGVAMGGLGSDAAIEAADVVLMTDEPSKLLDAIDVAAKTKRVVLQNIVFALGVKGVFLIMGALGVATMWEAVFADVGVTVIAILNAMRVLNVGKR